MTYKEILNTAIDIGVRLGLDRGHLTRACDGICVSCKLSVLDKEHKMCCIIEHKSGFKEYILQNYPEELV